MLAEINQPFDVLIVGAGQAGATLAIQLKKQIPNIRLLVLDRQTFPAPDAAHKVGESTVEVAAHYLMEDLNLGEYIKSEHIRKLGLRCFFESSTTKSLSERVELGATNYLPRSTYQIDRGRLETFLSKKIESLGIKLLSGTSVSEINLKSDGLHECTFDYQNCRHLVTSRWLVDASGRSAFLRKKLQLEKPVEHKINAAWMRVAGRIDIDSWGSNNIKWKQNMPSGADRWRSTNHLMGTGYWVWIIPLSSGSTSIGIVADPRFHSLSNYNSKEKFISWLIANEPQCGETLQRLQDRIQDFHALKTFSRNITQVFSSDRWAITGDAAIFLDPLYSPGADFIAYGNTFITDLIARELSGKRVNQLCDMYNKIFFTFADNSASIYQDMYETFGNPNVMPVKVIWDFLTYLTFFGFVFTQGKLCDLVTWAQVQEDLDLVSKINLQMQRFFLEWHRAESPSNQPQQFVDFYKMEPLHKLHQRLIDKVEEDQFVAVLKENIADFIRISAELVRIVRKRIPSLAEPGFVSDYDFNRSKIRVSGDVYNLFGQVLNL